MGFQKPKESLISAIKSTFSTLTKTAGSCRINICQPFSLQEFVSSNTPRPENRQLTNSPALSSPMSRFGSATDIFGEKLSLNLTDVNRKIIKKLAAHAAYDASRGTAMTATNVVAFLLLTRFRSGATVEQLTAIARILHREVEYKGVCFSFSGETDSVVVYGISVLGEHLVLREEKKVETVATASASGAETTTTTKTSNPVTIQSTIAYRP